MKCNFDSILTETRLIAILRGIPSSMLTNVLDILQRSGIRLAEITYDTSGKISDHETARSIEAAAKYMDGKMLIGAGTVLTPEQVEKTKAAGGTFIISPHMDPVLIQKTKAEGLISIPGVMTVTEAYYADCSGADYIKLFPASSLGADFIKNIHGPFPQLKVLAVGGIGIADIPVFLNAGVAGFGIGSAIVNKKLCSENRLDLIETNAHQYFQACWRGRR